MEYMIILAFACLIILIANSFRSTRLSDYDKMKQDEEKDIVENPANYEIDTDQVWIEYMGVSFPLYRFEIPRWTCLTVDEKQKWVKQLKQDIKDGKKIPIKENGKIVGYKVKDRKTIRNEDLRTEIYKKANNL
jgi:hypothetical protein